MENAALELSREGGGSGYPWRQVGVVLERQCVPGQTGQAKAHQLQFVAERHYCPNTAVAFFAILGLSQGGQTPCQCHQFPRGTTRSPRIWS